MLLGLRPSLGDAEKLLMFFYKRSAVIWVNIQWYNALVTSKIRKWQFKH